MSVDVCTCCTIKEEGHAGEPLYWSDQQLDQCLPSTVRFGLVDLQVKERTCAMFTCCYVTTKMLQLHVKMEFKLSNCPQLKQFSQRLFQISQHLQHSSTIKWGQQNKNWTDHVNVARRRVERIKSRIWPKKKWEFDIQKLSCFVFCIFSLIKTHVQLSNWHLKFYFLNQGVEIIIIPKTGCVFTEGNKTYLEESMETWFLFLTSSDGLLTHFKEVDKRWVGLHQLFRLGRRWRGRQVRDSRNGFRQYLIGPEPVGVYHFTESLLHFFGESGPQGHTCCVRLHHSCAYLDLWRDTQFLRSRRARWAPTMNEDRWW